MRPRLLVTSSRRYIQTFSYSTLRKPFTMYYDSLATPESCYVDFCLLPVRHLM
jgi:hypothetical protein